MRRFASVGGINGLESVTVAVAYELRLEMRLEAVLSAASRALISVYCVFVVASNRLRASMYSIDLGGLYG